MTNRLSKDFPGSSLIAALRQRLTLVLFAALLGASPIATADHDIEINEIVVFGDSLSDTGNVFTLTGFAPTPATQIPASPQWFNGRFTNGPVWHEVFAEGFGIMPQSLPSFVGGLNFAWGGAEYGPGPAANGGVPNVGAQIDYYLTGTPPAFLPFLPPLPPASPSSDQLFIVQAGNNDLIPPGPPADPETLVDFAVQHISTLAAEGARHFLVPSSLVDDTDTKPGLNPPLDRALFGPEGPAPGQVEDIIERATQFNRLLHRELFRLERRLNREYDEPVTITYVNLSLVGHIVSRWPSVFGIDNIDQPALDAGFFPPTCFCGGKVADHPNRFFYFDIVHPTATVHAIYGEAALRKLRWKLALARLRR